MGTKDRFKAMANRFVTSRFNDLTDVFTIEQKTNTQDGQGGFTVTWSTLISLTGFTRTKTANETNLDGHIKEINIRSFSFEYIAGIDASMRIDYAGVKYNILTVKSVEDSEIWTILTAKMAVAT